MLTGFSVRGPRKQQEGCAEPLCVRWRPPLPAEAPRAWWEYSARPVRRTAEEESRFRQGLLQALRVGAGLGVRFQLRWNGGVSPHVQLRAADEVSGRWLRAAVFAAYQNSRWTYRGELTLATGAPCLFASPSRHALPLAPGAEGVHWGDGALTALATLPEPVSAFWAFQGVPTPTESPLGPHPEVVRYDASERVRSPTPTSTERSLRDQAAARTVSPRWVTSVRLVAADGGGLPRAARTLELLSALPGGNHLRFLPPRWPKWRNPPEFWISESELLSILPSMTGGAGAASPVAERGNRPLRLGIGPTGSPSLLTSPSEGRHLLVLGETGMGKSTVLIDLAVKAARLGAIILLDPVGDTAERFLHSLRPTTRERVTWVSAERSPIGLNALAECQVRPASENPNADRALTDLVGALRRVRAARFGETLYWGPRIEETVTWALRAASLLPCGTLVDAARLLEEGGRIPPGVSGRAHASIAALRARVRERPDDVEGSRRLLSEVANNSTLVRLLCEPRASWSVREAVLPRAITVVSGDASWVGETTTRYLVSVYLALIWSALMSRPAPTKTFLVLDEAQWYFHESAAEILRMGRRFNVHLWTATQGLRGLSEPSREALLTNCADFLLFRGAPDDAREFCRWVPSVSSEELLSLPRGHACLLLDKGCTVTWAALPSPLVIGKTSEDLAGVAAASLARHPLNPDSARSVAPGRTPSGVAREVLLTIAAGLAAAPPGAPLSVDLDSLRAKWDPEGAAIREAGAWLGQRESIQTFSGPGHRRGWEVRADGWFDQIDPPPSLEEQRAAAGRWRELAIAAEPPAERQPFKEAPP